MIRSNLLLQALLVSTVLTCGSSFSSRSLSTVPCFTTSRQPPCSAGAATTSLGLFWFGKGDGDKENDGEGLGGVAQVMESMDGFKKSQQVGTLTSNLVQGLGSVVVEGSAAEGKVRVFMDGQQRPKRVQIDEEYGQAVDVDDLSTALLTAMQDCYTKSREKQEEKMKDLYTELGLSPSAAP